MIFYLLKGQKEVVRFDAWMCEMAFGVSRAEVLDKDLLPYALRPFGSDPKFPLYLKCWLASRMLPMYRQNMDPLMASAYRSEWLLMQGRLGCMRHTAAFLSYFLSPFDDFAVTPEHVEFISYVLQDHSWRPLFHLEPWNGERKETCQKLLRVRHYTEFPAGPFLSLSFTIPSLLPSWTEERGGKQYLVQEDFFQRDKPHTARKIPECSEIVWERDLSKEDFGRQDIRNLKPFRLLRPDAARGYLYDRESDSFTGAFDV